MLTVENFDSAKLVLSAKDEFGPPSMSDYIELLEREANVDFSNLKNYLALFLPFMHGETHLKIRKTLNKFFTRHAVSKWTPKIISIANYRLSQLEEINSCDLIVDILDPLYTDFVETLFGVKIPDRQKFIRQIEVATNSVERMASMSQLLKLQTVLLEFDNLISTQLNTFPTNTLFNEIVSSLKDDLTVDEIVTSLIVLLIAPRATTETLGHIILAFSQLETEKRKNFSSALWVEAHINDLIRLYASTNLLSKEAKKDVEISGCPVSAGSQVLINIPAVNRDPSIYKDQTTLGNLNEKSNQTKHLTFGAGSHICPGAEIAKVIIKEFIPLFFTAFPSLSCESEHIEFYSAQIATRIKKLPVKLA
jgi:cytochrome P450